MRAVFFDLDGTLIRFDRGYREILADAVRDVTGHAPAAVLDSYDDAFYRSFGDFEPKPVERAFETIQRHAEPEALADALLEREIEAGRPPDGAAEDLARLGERFRLGVLTNGVGRWQSAKLQAHGLEAYFDAFVASYEAGEHKPATAPFRLAERRLPADAYALVGDDDVDVQGALDAGWTAYRYDGDGFGALPGALDWE